MNRDDWMIPDHPGESRNDGNAGSRCRTRKRDIPRDPGGLNCKSE